MAIRPFVVATSMGNIPVHGAQLAIPVDPSTTALENLVPNQTMPTIGDRLSDKDISWAWYSGGWNDALAGNPDPLFQYHHQPFAYYANQGASCTTGAWSAYSYADSIGTKIHSGIG